MSSSLLALPLALLAVGAAPVVAIDHHGPVLLPEGVALEARLVSTTGRKVFEPAAFVRLVGEKEYVRLPMAPLAGDLYRAPLPAALSGHECEYFLEAFDEDGNGPFRRGSPERPLRLSRPQPAAATPRPTPAVEPAPGGVEAEALGRPLRTAGIALLAGGGALLLAGGISGALALKDYEAEKAAKDLATYDSAKSAAKAESVAADVLLGTGAAAAIVGIILWASAPNPAPPSARPVAVSAAPLPGGGACAVVSGSF